MRTTGMRTTGTPIFWTFSIYETGLVTLILAIIQGAFRTAQGYGSSSTPLATRLKYPVRSAH